MIFFISAQKKKKKKIIIGDLRDFFPFLFASSKPIQNHEKIFYYLCHKKNN